MPFRASRGVTGRFRGYRTLQDVLVDFEHRGFPECFR